MACVAGDPGIGKSTLVAAVLDDARAAGARTLAGRATALTEEVPFGVWASALDAAAATVALPAAVAAELAAALPSLGPAGAGLVEERQRLGPAMRTLLERLAGGAPLVVALDDLHWADAASIDVLGQLIRRPPAHVRLVLALRPRQAAPRLAAMLERGARDEDIVRVDLGPLDDGAAEPLVAGLGERARREVLAAAEGNPLVLVHLARAGAAGEGLAGALAAEIATLDADARATLDAATIAGDPFAPELLVVAADRPEAAVLAGLDDLLARDLVRATEVPRRFVLRHPLVRELVYAGIALGARRAAHARVAAALRARGEPPEALAHHVALSATPGDTEAAKLLRDGAANVLARAPDAAARWLSTARRLAGGADVALLEALSTALVATGRAEEGRDAVLEAIDHATGDHERARLVARYATVEHRLGRYAEAGRRLTEELGRVAGDASSERLLLRMELAVNAFNRGDLPAMEAWAAEAAADAAALGDRPHAAAAHAATALAEVIGGQAALGAEHVRETAAMVDALTDAELSARLDVMHLLTIAEMYSERFDEMVAHATRAIAVARTAGQGELVPLVGLARGFGETMLGRLGDANRHFDALVEAARLAGNDHALSWVLTNHACAAWYAGDLDAGLTLVEEAIALADGAEPGLITAYPFTARAGILLDRGEHAAAAEELLTGAGGPEIALIVGFWRCVALDLLARAELGRGDRVAAERASALCTELAAGLGQELPRGYAARAQAALLLDAGQADLAATRASEAAAALRRGRSLVDSARATVLYGRALAAAGHREAAIAALRLAHDTLGGYGARHAQEEAARELRRLGQRIDGGLSAREREVAELVRLGHTNREIAAALVLSEKTVESHLRRLFVKLRVTARSEIGPALDRA